MINKGAIRKMKKSINKLQNYLSIGELSEMTGIGVHTLRVWEKRYGAPHSQRLPSGHRRYPKDEVPRLKAIASALESGYRASKVVTATMEELQGLMGLAPFNQPKSDPESKKQDKLSSDKTVIEGWVKLIHAGKDDALLSGFHEQFGRHGSLNFICDFAVPLLERIGNGWETGELTITHEHFASECLVSFLSEKWRQMNVRKTGPMVIITSLPGEGYSLGILMCAVITSITNSKIMYLGLNSPLEEIVDASEKYNVNLVTISISHKFDFVTSKKLLIQLRENIEKDIPIVTGGKGSPCNIEGVDYIASFEKYYSFLSSIKKTKITRDSISSV
jgi:MerR family transcriptional regulator, light-induced transcriptional regulator